MVIYIYEYVEELDIDIEDVEYEDYFDISFFVDYESENRVNDNEVIFFINNN